MSFGFSVSDLIMGSQLAYDIYQQCFTKARGAGEWYLPLLCCSLLLSSQDKTFFPALCHVIEYCTLDQIVLVYGQPFGIFRHLYFLAFNTVTNQPPINLQTSSISNSAERSTYWLTA